ncbi:MAG: hypothetical protein NT029_12630 [Armatimonadetes bacterium]|nr:hypothetical protein [Armatimonadota bacterium]
MRTASIARWMFGTFAALAAGLAGAGPRSMVSRALIVGGGPDLAHNQVSIESNVRYVDRLLPRKASRTVLYADGDAKARSVLAEVSAAPASDDEKLLIMLLNGPGASAAPSTTYRMPEIGRIDGPSSTDAVTKAFADLRAQKPSSGPLLLYFTGHGSMDKGGNLDNNVYDLWGGAGYSVQQLAAEVAQLPAKQPVALVMVQCFSGSFGNLLFQDGKPKGAPLERDIAGFFASLPNLPAAGCTPEVNEADYHDFTSYFFAALTGIDRLGRKTTGADANRDGRVGMDEAFCYALINDKSIDVPVCTSDVFLRANTTAPDADLLARPYRDALAWATPAQAGALTELSAQLKLDGDDRGTVAFARYRDARSPAGMARGGRGFRSLVLALRAAGNDLKQVRPALADRNSAGFQAAYADALKAMPAERAAGRYAAVEEALKANADAGRPGLDAEIQQSRLLRFVRLFKTVVLTHDMVENGDPALRARFKRLIQSEQRTILPRA